MELCLTLCASQDGKGCGGEWIHGYVRISMAESLHCSPEPVTALLTSYNPIKNVLGVKKKKNLNNKKFRLNTFLIFY